MNLKGELRNKGGWLWAPSIACAPSGVGFIAAGVRGSEVAGQAAGLAETLSVPGFVFVHVYFPVGKWGRG